MQKLSQSWFLTTRMGNLIWMHWWPIPCHLTKSTRHWIYWIKGKASEPSWSFEDARGIWNTMWLNMNLPDWLPKMMNQGKYKFKQIFQLISQHKVAINNIAFISIKYVNVSMIKDYSKWSSYEWNHMMYRNCLKLAQRRWEYKMKE